MRIIFMGTPEFAVPSLKALIDSEEDVAALVSQPDRPRGRGRKLAPTPTKLVAQDYNIPVLQPDKIRDDIFLEEIGDLEPSLIVVAAYGKILPKTLLELPPHGCINVHASLLPCYRGAAPINWAVVRGEKVTGVTTMQMDEGMDTGDMLLKKETPIEEQDTGETLTRRLSVIGAELLIETIKLLKEGALVPEKQDESKASYAPMLKKEDGLIDWKKSSLDIRNLIRGMLPWPGAFTRLGDKILKIYSAKSALSEGRPGEVLSSEKGVLEVACGEGSLVISELQIEGGKRLEAKSFLSGRKIEPGTILG
jgi:methionyl-tRNA formyltransferase